MKIALSLLVAACLLGLGLSAPSPVAEASPAPASFLNGLLENFLDPILCGLADIVGEIIVGVLYLVAGIAKGILS